MKTIQQLQQETLDQMVEWEKPINDGHTAKTSAQIALQQRLFLCALAEAVIDETRRAVNACPYCNNPTHNHPPG